MGPDVLPEQRRELPLWGILRHEHLEHPNKSRTSCQVYQARRRQLYFPKGRLRQDYMKIYEFKLRFSLKDSSQDPETFLERLREEGCTDALIGIGQRGRIALLFAREASSALEAILNAIRNVKNAIPEATLIETAPDLVGLSDIAEILGCSRQNIRKLMLNNLASFPTPIHEGKTILWHLSSVLRWAREKGRYQVDELLEEIAEANMQLNIAKESVRLDATIQKQFRACNQA
jgi:hypothetical protein